MNDQQSLYAVLKVSSLVFAVVLQTILYVRMTDVVLGRKVSKVILLRFLSSLNRYFSRAARK